MSGQHCKSYDVKRETVHCYRQNVDRCCTWSEVTWCYRWNLGSFFKNLLLFCFLGEQWILFSSNLNVSLDLVSGNKMHCSPRDQSLSVKYSSLLKILLNQCKFLLPYSLYYSPPLKQGFKKLARQQPTQRRTKDSTEICCFTAHQEQGKPCLQRWEDLLVDDCWRSVEFLAQTEEISRKVLSLSHVSEDNVCWPYVHLYSISI